MENMGNMFSSYHRVMFVNRHMSIKTIFVVMASLATGVLGGYSFALVAAKNDMPSYTDVQLRSFSASYGALRNIKEKSNSAAISLMYTMMNNSIKEMYNLYPNASEHDKEMIYTSFKGYSDYILDNPNYQKNNSEINKLVVSLLKKHNKSSNLTGDLP